MSFNCYHIRSADFNSGSGGQVTVITRDNYEAYLVMYVDEELNAAEREAVEQFIQQNPDLSAELVMLQESVLQPDERIVFEQKESLFRNTAVDGINEGNYEEYFVLYGDDELTNEEKDKVEQFVYKHPQYQADFELIQQVKLVPDNSLSFPGKAYLFRSEEDNRVIAFPWWRFSAAAIALLSIGSMVFYFSTQFVANKETARVLPQTKPIERTQVPATGNNNTASQADVAIAPLHEDNNVVAQPVKADKAVAKNSITKNISKPSNIQLPSYVQQVNTQQPEDVPAGDNEKSLSARSIAVVVTNQNERPEVKATLYKNTVSKSLTSNTAYVQPIEEPDQSAVTTATVNKTPLRGFFRKVSRVVDKVTGPDENGKAGIRIANLEFALQ